MSLANRSSKPTIVVHEEAPLSDDRPSYLRSTLIQVNVTTLLDSPRRDRMARHPEPDADLKLPSLGEIVGSQYRLVRLLGQGAFGKVYAAQRLDVPEHQVALKILPRSLYAGRNVERELVMLATVGHPNVVQLKDHGTGPSYVWLTMPIYEGETLADRLGRETLTLREAYDIFLPIARGLEALHAAGLRHQDIKPENIFLAVFGGRLHPVLLDLGVAAEREATFVAGTIVYGSPEQTAAFSGKPGSLPLTEKMDTYGLGATILVALAGAAGFPGMFIARNEEIGEAQAVRAERPLGDRVLPDLCGAPRGLLERALQRWLALDPSKRPAMSELADDLDVLLEQEREAARSEEALRARQKALMLRLRIAVVGVVALAFAGGSYVFSKRETLRLATDLEAARREGAERFDKLDTCISSHALEKSAASACKAERDKDRVQHQATIDAMAKADSPEPAKDIQDLSRLYSGRLRSCEESSAAAEKACLDDRSRRVGEWADERAKLVDERDKAQKLADERAATIEALTEREDVYAPSTPAARAPVMQSVSTSSPTESAPAPPASDTSPAGPQPPEDDSDPYGP